MLYAGDLAVAFDKFANSKIKHAVFNIGGGRNNTVSLLEFLEYLPLLTGKKPKVKFSTGRRLLNFCCIILSNMLS